MVLFDKVSMLQTRYIICMVMQINILAINLMLCLIYLYGLRIATSIMNMENTQMGNMCMQITWLNMDIKIPIIRCQYKYSTYVLRFTYQFLKIVTNYPNLMLYLGRTSRTEYTIESTIMIMLNMMLPMSRKLGVDGILLTAYMYCNTKQTPVRQELNIIPLNVYSNSSFVYIFVNLLFFIYVYVCYGVVCQDGFTRDSFRLVRLSYLPVIAFSPSFFQSLSLLQAVLVITKIMSAINKGRTIRTRNVQLQFSIKRLNSRAAFKLLGPVLNKYYFPLLGLQSILQPLTNQMLVNALKPGLSLLRHIKLRQLIWITDIIQMPTTLPATMPNRKKNRARQAVTMMSILVALARLQVFQGQKQANQLSSGRMSKARLTGAIVADCSTTLSLQLCTFCRYWNTMTNSPLLLFTIWQVYMLAAMRLPSGAVNYRLMSVLRSIAAQSGKYCSASLIAIDIWSVFYSSSFQMYCYTRYIDVTTCALPCNNLFGYILVCMLGLPGYVYLYFLFYVYGL